MAEIRELVLTFLDRLSHHALPKNQKRETLDACINLPLNTKFAPLPGVHAVLLLCSFSPQPHDDVGNVSRNVWLNKLLPGILHTSRFSLELNGALGQELDCENSLGDSEKCWVVH